MTTTTTTPDSASAPPYFVNPSRNVPVGLREYFFYPIANSAALDICEDIPKPERTTDDPLTVCFLAAGDVRNVLFTTYKRRELGDERKLQMYVNDINPAIIAKNILMLQLAAQTPLRKSDKELDEHVDLFLSLWADLALNEDKRKILDVMLTQHLEEFTGSGDECFMTVPEQHHLWEIKKAWAVWLSTTETLSSAEAFRKTKTVPWHTLVDESGRGVRDQEFTYVTEGFMYAMELTPTPRLKDELTHYLRNGTMRRPGNRRCLNTTMRDPQSKQLPQITSNPFITYHNASEPGDYLPAETHSLYNALHKTVKRLLVRFATEVSHHRVSVYFDIGDCSAYLATRLESNVRFHAIDTSNVLDHTGMAALLVLAALRINRQERNSTIWTETVKSPQVYDSVSDILDNSLWIPYSILPTVLQLKCTLPFESCLDFKTELGRLHKKVYLTGIKFKWTPANCGTTYPCKVDLLPDSSSCVFRQMIDNMLETLCTAYVQAFPNFHFDEGFYPHSGLCTIPAMMTILLCATRQMKNPQNLLNYLYKKVTSNLRLQVLSFDVQNIANQMYPVEMQPNEPLHPIFSKGAQQKSSLFFTPLQQRKQSLPCPVTGGVLIHGLVESERRAMFAPDFNAKTWITKNWQRVQFIDSYTISLFPVVELEVRLPNKLVYPKTAYSIIVIDLMTGWLVFEPVDASKFKLRQLKEKKSMILNILTMNENLPKTSFKPAKEQDDLSVSQVHETKTQFLIFVTTTLAISDKVKVRLKPGENPCELTLTLKNTSLRITLPNHCHEQNDIIYKSQISDRTIRLTVTKPKNALKPNRQLLNLDTLRNWPNKPFGANQAMFTVMELSQQQAGSYAMGHSCYYDARLTIAEMFSAFTDKTLAKRDIFIIRRDGYKLFHLISSLEKGIIGHSSRLLASPRGIPIIEFWYLCSDGDATPDVDHFLSYLTSSTDVLCNNNRGINEEVDFLRQQLKKNAERIVNTAPKKVQRVFLKRSFFIPLYPKEHNLGQTTPNTEQSAFSRQLNQWRQESGIPSPISASTKKCFSCSTTENLKACGRCKTAWFCSKDCQKAGWKKHKSSCMP